MSTSIDVDCDRCSHPIRAHQFTGLAQRGLCKTTIIGYPDPMTPGDVPLYLYPCDCPQPMYTVR